MRVACAGAALCLPFHVPLPTVFFPSRLTSPCASLCFAGISDPTVYCIGESSSASGGGHAVWHVAPWAVKYDMWTLVSLQYLGPAKLLPSSGHQVPPEGLSPLASDCCIVLVSDSACFAPHGDWPTSRMVVCHHPLTASVAGRRPDMLCSFLRMGVPNSPRFVENTYIQGGGRF